MKYGTDHPKPRKWPYEATEIAVRNHGKSHTQIVFKPCTQVRITPLLLELGTDTRYRAFEAGLQANFSTQSFAARFQAL
jgi:hypothetical protein